VLPDGRAAQGKAMKEATFANHGARQRGLKVNAAPRNNPCEHTTTVSGETRPAQCLVAEALLARASGAAVPIWNHNPSRS